MNKLKEAIDVCIDYTGGPLKCTIANKEDELIKSQCKIVPSNMPDVTLYSFPGKALDHMCDIGREMKRKIRPLKYRKPKTFRADR